MENGHLHDDKLFRAVHDRLSDYEAPANGADWDAMSRALDNLPKSARYRWKFSLNSILVIVGLVGVSALSFALVTKTGNSPESKSSPQAIVTQPQVNTNPVVPVSNTQPESNAQNSFANANQYSGITSEVVLQITGTNTVQQTVPSTNSLTNTDGAKTKRKNKNQLLFGDQIDPKKGFIYNTKENSTVATTPVVDPEPNVFYDSENGQIKKIEIKRDSTRRGSGSKVKADSTANIFVPGVPTEGGPTGFDTE
ncbi:MAG: hypothetical protein M3R17_18985 [Bacteroidota bacterium]|nr:hypothetical protein [Bacteroidota bacterium]